MNVEKLSEILESVFKDVDVLFAYLHGSYARGEQTELSDLDIAVFSEEKVGVKKRARLSRIISEKTGQDVDIACLRNADIGFQHQVVRDGNLVYSVDEERRKRFEEEVYREYLDIKPLMKKFNRIRRSA